jgi:hypothetical protein
MNEVNHLNECLVNVASAVLRILGVGVVQVDPQLLKHHAYSARRK